MSSIDSTNHPSVHSNSILPTLLLLLLSLTYPTLVFTAFAPWACVSVGYPYPNTLWAFDTTQACYQDSHTILVWLAGLLAIPILVIAPPALVTFLLMRHRKELDLVSVQHKLLWLYHPYRPRLFCWEAWKLLATAAHVAAHVLPLQLEDLTRSLIMLAVVGGDMVITLIMRPHRFKVAMRLELMGAMANTLAVLLLIQAVGSAVEGDRPIDEDAPQEDEQGY